MASGLTLLVASLNGDFGIPQFTLSTGAGAMVSCIFGSLVPDIDLPSSSIGRITTPISATINRLFGHRTITHSPLLWFLVYLIISHQWPQSQIYALAMLIGAYSHLFLDLLNRAGISILWPIPTRFWIGGVKLDGVAEKTLCNLLSIASIVMIVNITFLIKGGG